MGSEDLSDLRFTLLSHGFLLQQEPQARKEEPHRGEHLHPLLPPPFSPEEGTTLLLGAGGAGGAGRGTVGSEQRAILDKNSSA